MRFKQWIMQEIGDAPVPMYLGGVMDHPANYTNSNLPVRSKYVTKDNSPESELKPKVKPDNLFGFRDTNSKNQAKERRSQYIDKGKQKVSITRIPPDIIYH